MTTSVAWGLAAGLAGSALNNFGMVLQKRQVNFKEGSSPADSGLLQPAAPAGSPAPGTYFKDPLWVLGILMQTLLCLPLFVYSLDALGITLGQPLANGTGLIFLVLGLVAVCHERLLAREKAGLGLLLAGVTCVGFGGVVGDVTFVAFVTPATQRSFWIYVIACVGIGGACFRVAARRPAYRVPCLGFLAGTCYGLVSVCLQVFTIAFQALTTGPGLLALVVAGVGLVGSTAGAIGATQAAFRAGQAINFVPFSQVLLNVLPVLAGLLVFGQAITYPGLFWAGEVLIIVAATCLARLQR